MSADILTSSREAMKQHLMAYGPLAAVPVFLERSGVDINNDVEAALNTKGLAIVILSAVGGVADQIRQGGATLRVTVPVCLLDNVTRNMAAEDAENDLPAGHNIPSEVGIMHVLKALVGKPVGAGDASVNSEVFARGEDGSGLIEHYIGIDFPVIVR